MTQPPPNILFKNPVNPGWIALIGSSVRAAADDAKRAGYQVIAIDRFGDADLREACDHWIPYDAKNRWIKILGEFPRCPLLPIGGFSWTPESLGSKTPLGPRLVAYPDETTLAELDSPERLAEVASRCGIGFPETWHRSGDATLRLAHAGPLRDDESTLWLRKPKTHAGGVGVRLADSRTPISADEYRQRRIHGQPIGANFIAVPNAPGTVTRLLGVFGGLTYHGNRSHPYLYAGSYGPLSLPPAIVSRLQDLGQIVAETFALQGLFNIDLILSGKRAADSPDAFLWLLEVNPRYSASMELFNLGSTKSQESGGLPTRSSLIDLHLACYQNRTGLVAEIDSYINQMGDAGTSTISLKRIVYAKREIKRPRNTIAVALEGASSTGSDKNKGQHVRVRLADLPGTDLPLQSGEPVCTVLVSNAGTVTEAFRVSARSARRIRAVQQ